MVTFSLVAESSKRIHVQVAKQIARKILSGELEQGEKLPNELELCELFGISRTALRESMKLLSAKGLLASRPKVGTKVLTKENWHFLDPQLLEWLQDLEGSEFFLSQFLGLRKAIEPEACALASLNATVEQRKEISILFQKMTQAALEDNEQAWVKVDLEFHCKIFQSTANKFFVPFGNILSTIFRRFIDRSAEGGRYCLEEHRAIYEAIMVGNPEQARIASARLLNDSNQRLATVVNG
ncbi:FadR/GntR family transcriptional regulator [Vibrio sp. TH_r3]|uniref:FadR/GntR family transcriptional regulator n=1 Tax=Vibrio sp. TH_r3 TaxID=3082084 RepID=UPI0029529B6E|nr:FadR/GntR family transcriptional regulator [Vibrio sp. TH_r3]MDV7103838.1 FadR/GntR family transcriptional regulator [Vibrio sp. TH_r3]